MPEVQVGVTRLHFLRVVALYYLNFVGTHALCADMGAWGTLLSAHLRTGTQSYTIMRCWAHFGTVCSEIHGAKGFSLRHGPEVHGAKGLH